MKKDNSTPVFAKPVLPAVLKLTVKKEWFDLIKSGEKTEEYREFKDYWCKRLIPDYHPIYKVDKRTTGFKQYDYIEFKNGYSSDAPTIITKCKFISIGKPTQNGKHLFDNDVFIISIGDIVWSNCG